MTGINVSVKTIQKRYRTRRLYKGENYGFYSSPVKINLLDCTGANNIKIEQLKTGKKGFLAETRVGLKSDDHRI